VPKYSLTWKTIHYTFSQWNTLFGYCEDGQLQISNASAENTTWPFEVKRRNWLFDETIPRAQACTTIFSLIETAKANHPEPYDYLLYILKYISSVDTIEKLESLQPWHTKLNSLKKTDPLMLTCIFATSIFTT
jgi:hypothetical protein